MKKIYLVSYFLLFAINLSAQLKNDCIQEVLNLENETFSKDYSNSDKTIFMSYTIQSTDWEGKITTSNVKIYRYKQQLNFFSEQVNMYKDESNTVIVLKPQQVIIINGVPKNVPSNYSDEFVELRKEFLKSCEVLKCEYDGTDKNIKTLEVRAKMNLGGKLKIDRMIYTYNNSTGKIIKCETYYTKQFQVKKIVMEFQTLDFNSDYKFTKSAKKQVLGKGGNLLVAYKGYELIDNTKDN